METVHQNGRPAERLGASGEARRGNVRTRWVLVTPELAEKWLQKNTNNRNKMPSLLAYYASEMADSEWLETHQGIAFTSADVLADGQHRLSAIVRSGCAQWMLVTEGLDPRVVEALDRGKVRSLAHALQITGHAFATQGAIAMARAMLVGPGPQLARAVATDSRIRNFLLEHQEAILFASSQPRELQKAWFTSVIARAWYSAVPDDLRRFCQSVAGSLAPDDHVAADRTAQRLGKVIRDISSNASAPQRLALYRKTQNALRAYLDGRVLDRIYEIPDDLFPLPAQKEAK